MLYCCREVRRRTCTLDALTKEMHSAATKHLRRHSTQVQLLLRHRVDQLCSYVATDLPGASALVDVIHHFHTTTTSDSYAVRFFVSLMLYVLFDYRLIKVFMA